MGAEDVKNTLNEAIAITGEKGGDTAPSALNQALQNLKESSMRLQGRIAATALLVVIVSGAALSTHARNDQPSLPAGLQVVDPYTLKGVRSFLTGYEPLNDDGTVNVVVEIPTGTIEKWEVAKPSGDLRWEFKQGKPRVIAYLGYPGNYGMLPRTLLSKESGGDGDPLDVIVLGPAVPRGSVVKARVIGILKLMDGGEQDDKILAVLDGTPLAGARSVEELDEKYPGVSKILSTWFESYKGPGEIVARGFAGPEAGMEVIRAAIASHRDSEE